MGKAKGSTGTLWERRIPESGTKRRTQHFLPGAAQAQSNPMACPATALLRVTHSHGKGGNTKDNHNGCGSHGSTEHRIPTQTNPVPAPSLPPLGSTSTAPGRAGSLQLATLPSHSPLPPPAICRTSLLCFFARVCCSGGSFSKQGCILLSASKAVPGTAKS